MSGRMLGIALLCGGRCCPEEVVSGGGRTMDKGQWGRRDGRVKACMVGRGRRTWLEETLYCRIQEE